MSMPIPPIGPLTGLSTSKSFSWTFAIDVDTALGAVAQFDTFDEDLTQADTFIRGALGLMSHQGARCVFDIVFDYSQLSDACDTVNHQADKLKEALSTYGAAMNTVRNGISTKISSPSHRPQGSQLSATTQIAPLPSTLPAPHSKISCMALHIRPSTTPRASRKWPSTSSRRHSTTSTRPSGKRGSS